MTPSVEQMRAQFNMMDTVQKSYFINNLKQHMYGVNDPEYVRFLNECIARYNAETVVRTNPAPGRLFIMVPGIVMIVGGGMGIIFGLIGIIMSNFWDMMIPLSTIPWSLYYAITLLESGWILLAGILGVRYCKTLEKAELIKGIAIASACVRLLMIIFAVAVIGNAWMIPLTIFGFAYSVLYIVGAIKNKNARQSQELPLAQMPPNSWNP